jgi:hypothetical protein
MKVLFKGQTPKDFNFPDENEDVYELAPDSSKVIISDGASESYDSKTWACLLVSNSIKLVEISGDWLSGIIADYEAKFDLATLPWSKQAAFARGSFATLLVVENLIENEINLFCVGDSLAVLVNNSEFVKSFPYFLSEEFKQRPELISTNSSLNTFLESPDFISKRKITWSIEEMTDPVVLCMTDALGQWALRKQEEGNPVWRKLCEIQNDTELNELVVAERLEKNMRVDDTTLIRLSFKSLG